MHALECCHSEMQTTYSERETCSNDTRVNDIMSLKISLTSIFGLVAAVALVFHKHILILII